MTQATEQIARQFANGSVNKNTWGDLLFNVKVYGAKGDGVKDDTAAILATLSAIPSTGGTLFFPSGIFMSDKIPLKPNVKVSGVNKTASILKPKTAGQTIFELSSVSLAYVNIEIADIGFRSDLNNVKAIHFKNCRYVSMRNLYFSGTETNIHCDTGNHIKVSDITVEGNSAQKAGKSIFESSDAAGNGHIFDVDVDGYQVTNLGTGVQSPAFTFRRAVGSFLRSFRASDLTIGSAATEADGILIDGACEGIKIMDSLIVAPRNYGVQVSSAETAASFTEIINVDVDQSKGNGIHLVECTFTNIIGGNLTTIESNAIAIYGAPNVKVTDVAIRSAGRGIYVLPDTSNFMLRGNRVESCTTGIEIQSGGTGNNYIVESNDLTGNTTTLVDARTNVTRFISDNVGVNYKTNKYISSQVLTLTGGGTTENVTISIPPGIFSAKPTVVTVMEQITGSDYLIGFYDYDNALNSATQVVVRLMRRDGTAIGAGGRRFGIGMWS